LARLKTCVVELYLNVNLIRVAYFCKVYSHTKFYDLEVRGITVASLSQVLALAIFGCRKLKIFAYVRGKFLENQSHD
jgi:hypothetical protein